MHNKLEYIKYNFFDKDFFIREISFFETRLFLKKIQTPDFEEVFDDLLSTCVENKNLNFVEKIILLFYIRGFIFGNEVIFKKDGKDVTINIFDVMDNFLDKKGPLTIKINDIEYEFDYCNNYNNFKNKISFIENSLKKVNGLCVKDVDDKLNFLPACNINSIHEKIYKHFYSFKYELKILDYEIDIYNIFNFLKNIYTCDLMDMYNIEYKLRRLLNFNTLDLKNNSLPECRILLNLYVKEQSESEVEQQKMQ